MAQRQSISTRSDGPRTVVVFAGGEPATPVAIGLELGDGPVAVIGADSGAERALAHGMSVDVLVGDLDSIGAEALAGLEAAGTRIERHPTAKNETDLALALDVAASMRPERIVVVGGSDGRFDHVLAAAAVLASPSYAVFDITAHLGTARLHVVRPGRPVELTGTAGEIVTLLAVGGTAEGVTTHGLVYPLAAEPLEPHSTRGVSNELAGPRGAVEIAGGTLLAVLPGESGDPTHTEHIDTED